MAQQTIIYTFNRNSFTSDSPSWSGPQEEYSSNLRFNTITQTLRLNNTNYSRGIFTISIPNNIDLGLIHFSTPNGSIVSTSDQINSVYELSNSPGSPISKIFTENGSPSSGTKTYYVIINGDPDRVTQHLNISIALAKQGSIPSSNPSVQLTYDCDNFTTLNEYTVGLHAYSAYDAKAGSSTLTTKLYTATTPGSSGWSINTVLYSSPYFNNPALPYFYGYNGKVYRVGDPWSRSYGTKFRYEVRVTWHWFLRRRVRSNRITLGPMETLDLGTGGNQPTSEACVEPTMRNVGKVRKVYNDDSTIPQPQQYRYYLGYDASNQRNSNDSVFTTYSLGKKKHFPITGLMHALGKLTRGIINGFNRSWDGDINWTAIAGVAGLGLISALFGETIISKVTTFFETIPGPLPSFTALFSVKASIILSTILTVLAGLFILWKLITFFSPKTHHYKENCKKFLHHFTTTPYINEGVSLYRKDNLDENSRNDGYYCDGVYYYQQSGGSIASNSKELSSTRAFVTEDEPLQFLYSLPADNPTLVEEWQKLILLSYTSGKPIPYCGVDENGQPKTVYYSAALTHTVTTTCCALEDCSEDIVISLPYGTVTSCISQTDADDEAEAQFQAAINYAEDHSVYNGALDNSLIGQLDVSFTHEIKEEDNPTSMALYFDNRSGSDAPVGTPLYYDFTGCQKALPGYYAVSSSNYPKYYYKVEGGEVAAIYTQSAALSTTVSPGNYSIVTTDKDKSSNWYLKSIFRNPLYSYIHFTNNRTFDVNGLLTSSNMSAGRILSGSYTNGAFEKYDTFDSDGITTTDTTEQGTGWYAPLNPWKPEDEDLFFYQNALTSWTGSIRYSTSGSAICTGGHTGNTYYHDGESSNPILGDRIYNTNDITDSIPDGYIKYTADLYLTVTDGIMVDSTNCNAQTNFSGSTLQTSPSLACNASTNQALYTHDGSGTYPSVGDTVTVFGGSAVSDGFINTDIGVLHMDDDGMVLQIISCPYDALPADMEVGFNSILGTAWYGYSDPNDLHIDSSTVMGDANELVNGFLNDSLDKIAESELGYHLITWLGWKDNNVYLTLRGTDTAITSWDNMSIKADLIKTGTHISGDYGLNTTNNNIYLTSPSGNGSEDYATTIISGMIVTGTGTVNQTVVSGTPSFSNVMGMWTIPVNTTGNVGITYSNVEGETMTFTKNNHTVYYYRTSATLTTYTNKSDSSGGTGDFLVYKWSSTYNPFVGSGQDVIIDFNTSFYSP